MARRPARRKSSTVTVDFKGVDLEGGGGGFRIPEGTYGGKVEKVEQDESEAGNDMFKWTFVGTEGKAKGKKFYQYTTLNEEALWKLGQLLEALGVEVPDGPMDIDLEEMVGLELNMIVTDETYQGKISSKMTDFEPIDGEEEEEEEEEELTPAQKRAAKRKATKAGAKDEEEEEEEDPPPRRGRKTSAKAVKYSSDEIREMDEDELASVIKKNKLDVDLDEHKTARRKSSAVITALEEAELIED